jgi:starvation-inducible DNA-binding protein
MIMKRSLYHCAIDISEKENKDIGTADFLTGMLQEHETIAWILRRYLS